MRISDWSSDVCSSDLHYSRAEPRLLPVKLLHHPPDRNDLNLFGTANMIAGQPCPSAPDVEAVLTRRNTRCPAESDGESRCRFEPAAIGNFLDCRPPFRRASFCKQCLGARDTAFSGKLGQCVPGGRAEHPEEMPGAEATFPGQRGHCGQLARRFDTFLYMAELGWA